MSFMWIVTPGNRRIPGMQILQARRLESKQKQVRGRSPHVALDVVVVLRHVAGDSSSTFHLLARQAGARQSVMSTWFRTVRRRHSPADIFMSNYFLDKPKCELSSARRAIHVKLQTPTVIREGQSWLKHRVCAARFPPSYGVSSVLFQLSLEVLALRRQTLPSVAPAPFHTPVPCQDDSCLPVAPHPELWNWI